MLSKHSAPGECLRDAREVDRLVGLSFKSTQKRNENKNYLFKLSFSLKLLNLVVNHNLWCETLFMVSLRVSLTTIFIDKSCLSSTCIQRRTFQVKMTTMITWKLSRCLKNSVDSVSSLSESDDHWFVLWKERKWTWLAKLARAKQTSASTWVCCGALM